MRTSTTNIIFDYINYAIILYGPKFPISKRSQTCQIDFNNAHVLDEINDPNAL